MVTVGVIFEDINTKYHVKPKLAKRKKLYFLCFKSSPMQLMMYLGNDLIESMTVNFTRLSEPGYLGRFKRQLKQRHVSLIQETGIEPEFLIVDIIPTNTVPNSYTSAGNASRA